MKRITTIFLQVVIVVFGTGVLTFMLWEPHLEGRNAHAMLFEIYFQDPFLAYAYIASIPFFVALYQAFTLLTSIRQHTTISQTNVSTLRNIKYCVISLIGFLIGAEAYFFIVVRGTDDIAGGVMMGLLMIVVSLIIATTAAVFEKYIRRNL